MAAETASREAYKVAQELGYRLQSSGYVTHDDQRAGELIHGWVKVTVQPIIDEREELEGKIAEMEMGWRYRVARFLRRCARLVEES